MPSILNATTTSGLVTSADNSGSLQLQTNNGTTAVTIDTSQNVGIGTSSPQARLHQNSTNDGVQAIFTGAQTGTTQTILLRSQYHTNNGTAGFANIGWFDNGSQGGGITFGTTSNGSGTTGTPTERMRIDSSGNLLVGTTAALQSVNTFIKGVGSRQICMAYSSGGYNFGLGVDSANYFYVQNQSGIGVYLSPNATSWTGLSDERLKTNLQPIENALEKVSTLRSVTGRYKTDSDDVKRAFLIAQDVQTVLPEAVTENLEGYLGLAYTETIPLLVAAIKELKAELDATKAEVQALKGVA